MIFNINFNIQQPVQMTWSTHQNVKNISWNGKGIQIWMWIYNYFDPPFCLSNIPIILASLSQAPICRYFSFDHIFQSVTCNLFIIFKAHEIQVHLFFYCQFFAVCTWKMNDLYFPFSNFVRLWISEKRYVMLVLKFINSEKAAKIWQISNLILPLQRKNNKLPWRFCQIFVAFSD